jgi:RNA polymerase sigma-70 factor (ECF subfamily)
MHFRFVDGASRKQDKLTLSSDTVTMSTTDAMLLALEGQRAPAPCAPSDNNGEAKSANQSLRDLDDHRLIARVAAQDQQALAVLYERYAARLSRYLSKLLKSRELIDEAVNDMLLTVWQKAGGFDPERAAVSSWIFGIAHKAGLKARRRSGVMRSPTQLFCDDEGIQDLPSDTHDPAATVLGWEVGRELMAALEQLSPLHRAVIELTFVEGFSYPQIAAILDCPESTVKTRMFYARKKLAQLLAHLKLEAA